MSFIRFFTGLATIAIVSVGACSKGNNQGVDTTLNKDLSLAQQNQAHLDSLSPLEANGTANGVAPNTALRSSSATTVRRTSESSAPRRTGSRSSRSSGTYSSGSAGTVSTTTTSGGEVVVKHTQRDAAIGAAAGAVIGATTSHSKVKGGLIGAAVGGLLGGVIGNNVDKQKKPPM
jgi:hypothetical protein